MPKKEATVDVLIDIANHVYFGDVKNLHIRRYKSGQNAGKLFAEYSLKDERKFEHLTIRHRTVVADLIKRGAKAISEGRQIHMLVKKRSPEEEQYSHYLAVKTDD